MLTRLYIDNYRCFVNFEYRPARRQLILGPNGSGKSSFLDALLFLRRVLVIGKSPESLKILNHRTLWMNQSKQTWELEASLDNIRYVYHLEIDSYGDPPRPRVSSESLKVNEQPIFAFEDGLVDLLEAGQDRITYPLDHHRSALATISEGKTNRDIAKFKRWFENLLCFRINPFEMHYRIEGEDSRPHYNMSNFGAWYRHLVQSDRREDNAFHESLSAALDDFAFLKLDSAGADMRLLFSEFTRGTSPSVKLRFDTLSDGQRCLIALYAILHFVLAKGGTVILDEPDNFISLRELQPWLMAVSDMIDNKQGQILLISHHPEFMNQWAPDFGVQFIRDGMGPVRVKKFDVGPDKSLLTPSEVIARGWEND